MRGFLPRGPSVSTLSSLLTPPTTSISFPYRFTFLRASPYSDGEHLKRHREFWSEHEIQQFWCGDSFNFPDEGTSLSYDLARLAVGALSHTYEMFKEFVLSADYEDAGEAAALKVFGGSLGGVIAQILGPGNCTPAPEKWPEKDDSRLPPLK